MIKDFKGKKVLIREACNKDLKNVRKFQDYINSVIEEDIFINYNKKVSLADEKKFLEGELKKVKSGKEIYLVAEADNRVVGAARIFLNENRGEHVGNFGIILRKEYRGIGLGNYLTGEIIKLAKKKLKPKLKIIKLSVFVDNKPAITLYKKHKFKEVACIPKQRKYKGKFLDELIMLLYSK